MLRNFGSCMCVLWCAAHYRKTWLSHNENAGNHLFGNMRSDSKYKLEGFCLSFWWGVGCARLAQNIVSFSPFEPSPFQTKLAPGHLLSGCVNPCRVTPTCSPNMKCVSHNLWVIVTFTGGGRCSLSNFMGLLLMSNTFLVGLWEMLHLWLPFTIPPQEPPHWQCHLSEQSGWWADLVAIWEW